MELIAPYYITVTSYELDDAGKESPTLTHIFWGQTEDEAVGNLTSHLITDAFFDGTLRGHYCVDPKDESNLDNCIRLTYRITSNVGQESQVDDWVKIAERVWYRGRQLGVYSAISRLFQERKELKQLGA